MKYIMKNKEEITKELHIKFPFFDPETKGVNTNENLLDFINKVRADDEKAIREDERSATIGIINSLDKYGLGGYPDEGYYIEQVDGGDYIETQELINKLKDKYEVRY